MNLVNNTNREKKKLRVEHVMPGLLLLNKIQTPFRCYRWLQSLLLQIGHSCLKISARVQFCDDLKNATCWGWIMIVCNHPTRDAIRIFEVFCLIPIYHGFYTHLYLKQILRWLSKLTHPYMFGIEGDGGEEYNLYK